MKNSFRKIATSLLLVVLTVAMAVAFTGCKKKADEIYIDGQPRLTYVVGQDLDFASASLVAVRKNKSEKLAFTSEEVFVTGYDKNQVGKQTVVVTAREQSVSFDVTVVQRMTFDGCQVDYLVGETEFSRAKGTVAIANDDGKITQLSIKDSKFTIEGFNGSQAATNYPVKVKYTNGSTVYESTLYVNVYEPEKITFTKPSSLFYDSHDTEFKIAGGYFKVTAKDGAVEKRVNLNDPEVEISGFDPTAATIDNMKDALAQKITVKYLGQEEKFDVYIKYSGVSLVKAKARELSKYDLSTGSTTLTSEEIKSAIDALDAYTGLSKEDKELISGGEISTIVKIVAAFSYASLTQNVLDDFKPIFEVSEDGALLFTAKNVEEVKTLTERLKNKEDAINVYSEVLFQVREDFPDVVILTTAEGQNITVASYLSSFYKKEDFELVRKIFATIVDLHVLLEEVPDNWAENPSVLSNYRLKIQEVMATFVNNEYRGPTYNQFYRILSSWRTNNDYFDIVYYFYKNIYYAPGANATEEEIAQKKQEALNKIAGEFFGVIPLPGKLEDLYMTLNYGLQEKAGFDGADAWVDTTMFMYQTITAFEIASEIKAEGGFRGELYDFMDFDSVIENNIGFGSQGSKSSLPGYFYIAGSYLYDEEFISIWKEYVAVLNELIFMGNQVQINLKESAEEISTMFEHFIDVAPSMQYAFMGSIYKDYKLYVSDVTAIDQQTSIFSWAIIEYYTSLLTYKNDEEETVNYENAQKVFIDLLKAIEEHFTHSYKNDDSFADKMDDVKKAYSKLEGDEKKCFDDNISFIYDKYVAIYEREGETEVLAEFEELENAIKNYWKNYSKTPDTDVDKFYRSISCYEKVVALSNAILENATEETKNYYYYDEVVSTPRNSDIATDYSTFDKAVFDVKEKAFEFMTNYLYLDKTPMWTYYDMYEEVSAFMLDAYGLLVDYNLTSATEVLAKYEDLEVKVKNVLVIMGIKKAMNSQIIDNLPNDDEVEFFEALIALEGVYNTYLNDKKNDEKYTAFVKEFEKVERLYDESFEESDTYKAFMKAKYDEIKAVYDEE